MTISTMEAIIDDVKFEQDTMIIKAVKDTVNDLSIYGGTDRGFKIYAMSMLEELERRLHNQYTDKFNMECEKAYRVIARVKHIINH